MKRGTFYAKEVRKVFNRLVREHGRPKQSGLTDPVEQLLLGILSRGTTEHAAVGALKRLREAVVDVNELRVSSPRELLGPLGKEFPGALEKARDINRALNEIFNREHNLELAQLRDRNRRDAKQYLEKLPGADSHTVASVMLLSIGGHAVPVDDYMLAFFQAAELVDAKASREEVEAFLERNTAASDAYAFYVLVRRHAAGTQRKRTPPKKKAASAGSRTKKRSSAKKKAAKSPRSRRKTS
jgi:endonuclease III